MLPPIKESELSGSIARLLHWAREQPDAPLLVTGGRCYSYSEFVRRAHAVSGLLRRAGFVRGQRVALFLEEYDQFFLSIFGVWLCGGVVIPLNTKLTKSDVECLIEKAAPAFLIVPQQSASPGCGPVPVAFPRDDGRLVGLREGSVEKLFEPLRGDELSMIMFTSGTTGLPKGVCLTLDSVGGNAARVAAVLGLDQTDRIFMNTPPYFTSGICHFLTLLEIGGSVVGQLGFFFGKSLLEAMQQNNCTGFGGAPAHLVRVVDSLVSLDGPSPRFWISSGDHLPQEIIEKLLCRLPGIRLFNMYGLTEVAGRLCVLQPDELARKPGSVGRPITDMTICSRDAEGHLLPADETGELYVTGPLLMLGYLDEPATTAQYLSSRGFRTGDFGRVDAEGFVWVAGRRDDIIKCGGEKVSLVQVQQALLALGMFADVAVIATPDGILGRVPVAFVVRKESVEFKASRVLRQLKTLLPRTSLPSRIVDIDEIPRTGSGKAISARLQKLLEGEG